MIICKYCGIHYEVFRATCVACGVPMTIETKEAPEKTQAQFQADRINRICDQYLNRDFKDGESISDKKMDILSRSFRIFPVGKRIFFYCDTTPFRTGKLGFLICEDGVYWQNSWTTPTNRNFLPWDIFKTREIAHIKYDLHLGKGDVIDLSALGSSGVREVVAQLFKQIHDFLNEEPQAPVG